MATGSGDLEGLERLGALLDVDQLALLDAEGGAVDELAVDQDVTVHDQLAGLRGGAGEAGTEHEGVQTRLEGLDEVLTGQTGGLAGLFEDDAELLLADAVLGAQTLLLTETDGVVAVLTTARTAVLTGPVGALLEVTGRLRRQRDAERARQAGLAAGA